MSNSELQTILAGCQSSWLSDLGLNLVAETFGIFVTVFFVDRLARRRERDRWGPAKNIMYARLLSATDQFLHKVFDGCIEEVEGVYSFGDKATSFVNHRVLAAEIFNIAVGVAKTYAERLEQDVRADDYLTDQLPKTSVDFAPFRELRSAVEFGIQTSQLLDHEDTRILLSLHEALSAFIVTIGSISVDQSKNGSWRETDFQSVEIFCDIALRSALEAVVYLQGRSTRFELREDYLDRVTGGKTREPEKHG